MPDHWFSRKHGSRTVAGFVKTHPEEVNLKIFLELTDPDRLPLVDKAVALELAALEDTYLAQQDTEVGEKPELSSLQRRCIWALREAWDDMNFHCEEFTQTQVERNPVQVSCWNSFPVPIDVWHEW